MFKNLKKKIEESGEFVSNLPSILESMDILDDTKTDKKLSEHNFKHADFRALDNDEKFKNPINSELSEIFIPFTPELNDKNASPSFHSPTNNQHVVDLDFSKTPKSTPKISSKFMPQSDIESECGSEIGEDLTVQDIVNIDVFSKEQLFYKVKRVLTQLTKYRGRYSEVTHAYKVLEKEREKMQNALSDFQDKSLRKLNEMRETVELTQQAKAHMEYSYRLQIDEKEQQLKAMQIQIQYLKDNKPTDTSHKTTLKIQENGNNNLTASKSNEKTIQNLSFGSPDTTFSPLTFVEHDATQIGSDSKNQVSSGEIDLFLNQNTDGPDSTSSNNIQSQTETELREALESALTRLRETEIKLQQSLTPSVTTPPELIDNITETPRPVTNINEPKFDISLEDGETMDDSANDISTVQSLRILELETEAYELRERLIFLQNEFVKKVNQADELLNTTTSTASNFLFDHENHDSHEFDESARPSLILPETIEKANFELLQQKLLAHEARQAQFDELQELRTKLGQTESQRDQLMGEIYGLKQQLEVLQNKNDEKCRKSEKVPDQNQDGWEWNENEPDSELNEQRNIEISNNKSLIAEQATKIELLTREVQEIIIKNDFDIQEKEKELTSFKQQLEAQTLALETLSQTYASKLDSFKAEKESKELLLKNEIEQLKAEIATINEANTVKSGKLSDLLTDTNREMASFIEKIGSLEIALKDKNIELSELKSRIEDLQNSFLEKTNELKSQHKEEINELNTKYEAQKAIFELEISSLTSQMLELASERDKYKEMSEKDRISMLEQLEKINKLNSQLTKAQNLLESNETDLQNQLDLLQNDFESKIDEIQRLNEELVQLRKEKEEEIENNKIATSQLQAHLDSLQREHSETLDKLQKLEEEIAKNGQELLNIERELIEARNEITQKDGKITNLNVQMQEIQDEKDMFITANEKFIESENQTMTKIEDMQKAINSKDNQITLLTNEVKNLKKELKTLLKTIAELESHKNNEQKRNLTITPTVNQEVASQPLKSVSHCVTQTENVNVGQENVGLEDLKHLSTRISELEELLAQKEASSYTLEQKLADIGSKLEERQHALAQTIVQAFDTRDDDSRTSTPTSPLLQNTNKLFDEQQQFLSILHDSDQRMKQTIDMYDKKLEDREKEIADLKKRIRLKAEQLRGLSQKITFYCQQNFRSAMHQLSSALLATLKDKGYTQSQEEERIINDIWPDDIEKYLWTGPITHIMNDTLDDDFFDKNSTAGSGARRRSSTSFVNNGNFTSQTYNSKAKRHSLNPNIDTAAEITNFISHKAVDINGSWNEKPTDDPISIDSKIEVDRQQQSSLISPLDDLYSPTSPTPYHYWPSPLTRFERSESVLSSTHSTLSHNSSLDPPPLFPETSELEYLRKIIYEYIMGHEPLTMAKVISAVLKFPDDKKLKIIEKEKLKSVQPYKWY